ncbi:MULTISPECIES: type 4 pilus major pilin [Gluconobacter]|jgi:hypothetical protein|uniref:type 4 pilus major pilin n=2 Tax=Acetobacteraceae TaxID=433 RepID=UPI00029AE667|nr:MULTISPECIES: type 4 pilus major pilin [Gluconobacter]KXV34249.1 hypothetical protein AD940_07555 [Gluconobacter thailandicus]MBS1020025.1 hypothetical protein [Gluconobacter cerinus]MBS1069543.1 hypothetical protein [Gluconobacter cerinus]GAP25988.1 hypothetical protein GLF_2870 [Gluconobacter frateurii NBRC 101659]
MTNLIGIIAAIIIGLFGLGTAATYAMRAYHGTGTTTAITEATDMWHQAHSVYGGTVAGGAATYAAVTNSNAIRASIVPQSMTTGDGSYIAGPWNGSYVTLSGSSTTFYEDWNNIPSSACAQFALSQPVNFLMVNGTGVWVNTGSDVVTQVTAACNQGSSSLSEVKFSYVDTAGQ